MPPGSPYLPSELWIDGVALLTASATVPVAAGVATVLISRFSLGFELVALSWAAAAPPVRSSVASARAGRERVVMGRIHRMAERCRLRADV